MNNSGKGLQPRAFVYPGLKPLLLSRCFPGLESPSSLRLSQPKLSLRAVGSIMFGLPRCGLALLLYGPRQVVLCELKVGLQGDRFLRSGNRIIPFL